MHAVKHLKISKKLDFDLHQSRSDMEPISENPDLPRNKRLKTNDSCDKFVDRDEKNEFEFSREPSMETLRQRAAEFANERDWNKYHTPRNLVLGKI